MENENNNIKTNRSDTESRKKDFLSAISSPECLGIVARACRKININRSTYYDWISKDPDFERDFISAQKSGRDAFDDEVEDAIYDLIQERDKTIVAMYAKTRLKNRGFVEKQEIEIDSKGQSVDINVRKPE